MRAFSLAELLIVIGIIGILIALLLPSVNKIRQQAKAAQCISNLSQIYKAQMAWKADNSRDKQSGDFVASGWMTRMTPYLASSENGEGLPRVYFCPGDDRPLTNVGNANSGTGGTTGSGGTGGGTGGGGTGGGGNTNAILPQNLAIRWYSDSYGTYEMPLAPGPRARVQNQTATSYELWFEQEPPTVNEMIDYNDAVIVLKDNGDGTTSITLSPAGDGSHHAAGGSALVDVTTGKVIWDHMYRAGGIQPGTTIVVNGRLPAISDLGNPDTSGTGGTSSVPTSLVVAHYGLNRAINSIMGKGDKVVGMDYLVDMVDPTSQGEVWNGTGWYNDNGILKFVRHGQNVNILYGDGSVKPMHLITPAEVKAIDPSATWMPWENSANWTPDQ